MAQAPVGVFDDALPERLRNATSATSECHVPVYRGAGQAYSPYIIRLTRGDESSAAAQSEIAALAASLVIDGSDEEDAPLALTSPDFQATPEEIGLQLREIDMLLDLPEADEVIARSDFPVEPVADLSASDRLSLDDILQGMETVTDTDSVPLLASDAAAVTTVTAVAEADLTPSEIMCEIESDPEPVVLPSGSFSWRRLLVLPQGTRRALAAFTGLSFLLVLPLQAMQSFGSLDTGAASIEAEGQAALDNFARGASAFADQRFTLAEDEFSRSAANFAEAEAELSDMHAAIVAVVNVIPQTDRTYDSVRGLITAGRELATVASTMSDTAGLVGGQESTDVVTKLNLLAEAIESAAPHAELAAQSLQDVDPDIVPEAYAERVAELQEYVPRLTTALNEFLTFSEALSTMLGGEGAMRYLVAFQNNTELRPTGGFIGSFAEMNVEHGVIEDMLIPGGGTYDVQGQLTEFVSAPGPLQLLKARWEMQDANWFPDFPSSARKLQWFYEHAGGPTTDGVIAVNATFIVNLLELTGPIEMPEYGRTIDAENFLFETQKIVELEYDKEENAPKAFLGDLAPKLLERITAADLSTFLAMLDLVGEGLYEKDIQVFFADNDLEAAIEDLGWSGSMKTTSGDYLMVVNTNLGGGKTDSVIEQTVDVAVDIDEDGSVTNTVTITKVHHGMPDALFAGRNNVDYLRLYVPEGSQLLSADGFEIPADNLFEDSDVPLETDEELLLAMNNIGRDLATGTDTWDEMGKTVFGNWMQTAPGETEVVRFTYRLPFTVTGAQTDGLLGLAKSELGLGGLAPYTMFVQKQSGVVSRETSVTIHLPLSMAPVWSSHPAFGSGTVSANNSEDQFYRLIVERE